jgi:hypothetical protein
MSNKHNLILLKEGQPWHIWRWGSLWPICNPTREGPRHPLLPDYPLFKTSIHHNFDNRHRKICESCLILSEDLGKM